VEILVDSIPPVIEFSKKEIEPDGTASLLWTITDDSEDITVMISVDGENFIQVPGTSYSTATLPPGEHTIRLRIIDPAGNQAEETWSFTIEEEKDKESGGSSGLLIIIILIVVVLIIASVIAVLIILGKRKEEEPEEKKENKVTVPSGPPGISSRKVDNNMLAAPPVNQMRELPAAGPKKDEIPTDNQ
jgi:hypothetical protein